MEFGDVVVTVDFHVKNLVLLKIPYLMHEHGDL